MNLERSEDWNPADPSKAVVFARFTDAAKRSEWQWRKHYRVWEANRKRLPLPRELHRARTARRQDPAVRGTRGLAPAAGDRQGKHHDAYSGYLTGFDELARLKIAGAYCDEATRTLHLFGVTQDDAPVYYYRRSTSPHPPRRRWWHRSTRRGSGSTSRSRYAQVSPIVLEGRLYLFWVETRRARSTRSVEAGRSSAATGTQRPGQYSMLRPDGAWSAPQLIRFDEAGGSADARIVEDPLDLSRLNALKDQLKAKEDLLRRPLVGGQQRDAAREGCRRGREARTRWTEPPRRRSSKARQLRRRRGDDIGVTFGVPPEVRQLAQGRSAHGVAESPSDRGQLACEDAEKKNDVLNATPRHAFAVLKEEIARLKAAIGQTMVMVRWDGSKRDHKDALDSYKPEGWQWDRVYPDVMSNTFGGAEPTHSCDTRSEGQPATGAGRFTGRRRLRGERGPPTCAPASAAFATRRCGRVGHAELVERHAAGDQRRAQLRLSGAGILQGGPIADPT